MVQTGRTQFNRRWGMGPDRPEINEKGGGGGGGGENLTGKGKSSERGGGGGKQLKTAKKVFDQTSFSTKASWKEKKKQIQKEKDQLGGWLRKRGLGGVGGGNFPEEGKKKSPSRKRKKKKPRGKRIKDRVPGWGNLGAGK